MKLDTLWLFSFFMIFIRSSAMFLSSPIFGTSVPPRVRILFCGAFSICLLPLVRPTITTVPSDLSGVAAMVGQEVAIGLIIGMMIQFLMLGAQMAGALMDMQMGFSMVQVFNPAAGSATTVLGHFKFLLFLVLFFLLDGHHQMIHAFASSYTHHVELNTSDLMAMKNQILRFVGATSLMAVQVAAPVAAVSFIVDAASGLVNKSIPNMPVYMVSMGAKTALGIVALSLGLPLTLVALKTGIEHTMVSLSDMLSIGVH